MPSRTQISSWYACRCGSRTSPSPMLRSVELEDLEGIRLGGQIVDRGLDHHPTLKRIRQ